MINLVVEGLSDEQAARAVAKAAGREVAKVYIAGGKTKLDPKIPNYNQAAQRMPWIVFRDSDGKCPVDLRRRLGSSIAVWSPRFALRIAHSMTEAWLLADRDGFAKFFGVRVGNVPSDPEGVAHAKRTVLQLCAASRIKSIRRDMVRSTGETGPLYVQRINEFAATHWDVAAASSSSQSLSRAIRSIQELS